MNRREALKIIGGTVVGLLIPTPIIANELKICYKTSNWFDIKIEFTKGVVNTNCSMVTAQDLIDSHGICATDELTFLIKQQLEYGKNLRQVYQMCSWSCPNTHLKDQLKIQTLNSEEEKTIHDVIKWARKQHNCCKRES